MLSDPDREDGLSDIYIQSIQIWLTAAPQNDSQQFITDFITNMEGGKNRFPQQIEFSFHRFTF